MALQTITGSQINSNTDLHVHDTIVNDLTVEGTLIVQSGNVDIGNTGVTAGQYGAANAIPVITVQGDGRITALSTTAVDIPSGVSAFNYTSSNNTLSITADTTLDATLTSFGSNVTFSGTVDTSDLTVSGNLTVSGTTTYVNTENLTVADAVITLNANQATPVNDIGIMMQRYATANSTNYNVGIVWEETADKLIIGKTPEDGSDNDISFGTEWMTVAGNGEVTIGGGDLSVTGAIVASDDITAFSDIKLKENIVTLPHALDTVKALRGVAFTRKDTKKASIGVIAQEVQQILPQVVNNKGDTLSVAYGNIVGVLIEAIKELSSKVESLEQKIQDE